ncbi:amino acid permease [Sulfurovum sp. zt1-1]|uniref:Amino acid permease n=1 Tax=Sulfurovum zhangzhouensis TaxID=3019067 RepID=A0ABT7QY58_9BACT|nr:amino acid permease [Sulfurovum zhangzhouensis]MDM5271767.1 amino acid permease [Sulfurovum zhangzhouensis]
MPSNDQAKLKRSVNLPMLVFYGLGNIFGAGIYVLIGKMAGIAGMYVPFSFLLACVVVFFTALSYAELSARFPLSAGEAVYVYEGFGSPAFSRGIGLLISFAGLLSSATILQGFHGYLSTFIALPEIVTILILVVILSMIAIWGIMQSMILAFGLTLAEIIGLVLVIYAGIGYIEPESISLEVLIPPLEISVLISIILGGFLAFYAFVGFEDMVNIAEEVKNPTKTMPRAIIITLVIATLFYIVVALVSVLVITPEILSNTAAPLAKVYETATGKSAGVLSIIAMVAVLNGALIQIIMASRIFYGMSKQNWLPTFLSSINPKTHTPVASTILSGALVFLFATFFDLLTLAQFSSFVIFIVFTLVNLSLILIKYKTPYPDEGVRTYPLFVPVMAILLNLVMLGFQIMSVI